MKKISKEAEEREKARLWGKSQVLDIFNVDEQAKVDSKNLKYLKNKQNIVVNKYIDKRKKKKP